NALEKGKRLPFQSASTLWRQDRLRFWLPGRRYYSRKPFPVSPCGSWWALPLLRSDFLQSVVEKLVNLLVGKTAFLPALPNRREDLVKGLTGVTGGLSAVY